MSKLRLIFNLSRNGIAFYSKIPERVFQLLISSSACSKLFISVICFFLLISPLSAETITVDNNTEKIYVGKNMRIYEDKEKRLTINGIISPDVKRKFTLSNRESPSFGFSDSAYWVNFSIKSESGNTTTWLLEIDYPLMDGIKLYEYAGGNFSERVSGYMLPFYQREVRHRNFIFVLELPPKAIHEYYLRFENKDRMEIPLTLWSIKAFHAKDHVEQLVLGIYYGILLVMFFYNLFLCVTIRDRTYFYYIMYIASFILWQSTQNGLAYEYLWPEGFSPHYIPQITSILMIFTIQFTQSFLNTCDTSKKMNTALNSIKAAFLVPLISPIVIGYSWSIILLIIIILPTLGLVLSTGLNCLKKKYRPAKYFMTAWVLLILGAVVYALKVTAMIPNNYFTTYAIQAGSALEVVLLSLGLGDRINMLREESEEARKTLLEEREKSLAIQSGMTESFSRFVPKEFLKFLGRETISDVKLGDQVQKEMTILFSDIRFFTNFSEKHTPQENIDFLNVFFLSFGPIIRKNNGFIDKYIGDAIMALFPYRVEDALNAAVDMTRQLKEFNEIRTMVNEETISIGIGIHTGQLMLGTIGEKDRIETTVISDAVNTASRMETLTKKGIGNIIISQDVYEKIETPEKYLIRKVGLVKIRGKEKTMTIYELKDYRA